MSTMTSITPVVSLVALLIAAAPAKSQETRADVEAYCAQKFGAGTQGTFDRRDNGPMCSEKASQGLGLLHHKVDPADICQTLHGTSRLRQAGPQIFCITGTEPTGKKDKVDLAAHCRDSYGQAAIVSRRLWDNRPLCTVKGSGGFSQIHHAIDLAELCGIGGTISPAAVEGDILDCRKAGSGKAAKAQAPGGDGPGKGKPASDDKGPEGQKRPGGRSEVPADAIIPITDKPDLTACGFFNRIDLKDLVAGIAPLPPLWNAGRAPAPCPALTGGFKPDLEAFCQLGGIPDNTTSVLPSGQPICHPKDYMPPAQDAPGFLLLVGAVCSEMYPDKDQVRRARRDADNNPVKDADGNYVLEGRLVPVTKLVGGEVECFYIDIKPAEPLTDWTDIFG